MPSRPKDDVPAEKSALYVSLVNPVLWRLGILNKNVDT